ncbi:hypothetical protein ACQKWADRAFT_298494 [Trichoderma austrokoningii]
MRFLASLGLGRVVLSQSIPVTKGAPRLPGVRCKFGFRLPERDFGDFDLPQRDIDLVFALFILRTHDDILWSTNIITILALPILQSYTAVTAIIRCLKAQSYSATGLPHDLTPASSGVAGIRNSTAVEASSHPDRNGSLPRVEL